MEGMVIFYNADAINWVPLQVTFARAVRVLYGKAAPAERIHLVCKETASLQ